MESIGPDGSVFCLTVKSKGEEKRIQLRTKLLGRHSIVNVSLCAALALELGVSEESIRKVVSTLEPTPHRLEYSFQNGIHILDDGYNGNVEGVKTAMEVLGTFLTRKVVVAQGIAEGGREKRRLNCEVGELLAKTADIVVLCGPNRKYLREGLFKRGYEGKTYCYKNLAEVQRYLGKIVHKGDVVLFQNDIPEYF